MSNQSLYIQGISFEKIFLSEIKTQIWNYTNPTGSPITFKAGTVFGIIPGTAGTVRDTVSTSTDGSQAPYGILINDVTIAGSATGVQLTLVVAGIVNKNKLVFSNGTDVLTTEVTISAVIFGTMLSVLTKGGIFPIPDTIGDYLDNGATV